LYKQNTLIAHSSFSIVIVLSFFLIFQINGQSTYLKDPGTFFHTRVGQMILAQGSFIEVDTFTFQFAREPWIAQQWLGEVVMGLLHSIGGFDALLMFYTLMLSMLFAWFFNMFLHSGMNYLLSSLLVALLLSSSTHHFLLRPHLFSLCFLAVVFNILLKHENETLSAARLWLLPIIVAIWSNTHGAALGGIGTIIIAATGWTIFYLLGKRSPIKNKTQITNLAAICLACCLAPLANPYGLELYATWQTIMSSPAVAKNIIEHAGMFQVWYGWNVSILGIIYAASLVGTWRARQKVVWYLPLVWFALSVGRIRHSPLFAVLAGIAIADFYPHIAWAKVLREKGSVLFSLRAQTINSFFKPALATCTITLIAGLILQHGRVSVPIIGHGWTKIDSAYWPSKHVLTLKKIAAERGVNRIFNDMLFGGFLTFHVPEIKIAWDDRCELLKDEGLTKYLRLMENESEMKEFLEKHGLEIALTMPGTKFAHYFENSPDWNLLEKSGASLLHQKIQQ